MIDPRTVLVMIPAYDGKLAGGTAGGLASCSGLYAAHSINEECSHVSLVRNLMAGQFLASPYEWLISIDNDIAFRRQDMELLLEPCDKNMYYAEDVEESFKQPQVAPPRPSRVAISQPASIRDLESRTLAAADRLVCAEYSFKNDALEPCKLGMGFVRIHRSVFEALQALKHDGGSTVEVQRHLMERVIEMVKNGDTWEKAQALQVLQQLVDTREDKAGQPRLWQVAHKGRMYYDYFPSGPLLSQFVPTAEWKGEDHGFFTLCYLAGIIPRIETRTRLVHMGRKGYPYLGPDVGGGQ